MQKPMTSFRDTVKNLAEQWLANGLPSRQGLEETAQELVALRERHSLPGIWVESPTMLTATLDDGLGQGLSVIEHFAAAIGLRPFRLGLMQAPEVIIDACRQHQPDFLGLTILHFDTEEELREITNNVPPQTRIVAGGPVFTGDPEFAERTGTHFAARNVADFLLFMLTSAVENGT